jgi:hypothetical protein
MVKNIHSVIRHLSGCFYIKIRMNEEVTADLIYESVNFITR